MLKIVNPPIKIQGKKTKIVPRILEHIPKDFNGTWFEPFFGSGVVGFNVNNKVNVVSDINPHIIRFYTEIKNQDLTPEYVTEYLIRESEYLVKIGVTYYYAVRQRFNANPNSLDFLFLSRTSFNGVQRFNKSGNYNTPFCNKNNRFSKAMITKITNQVRATRNVIRAGSWVFLNTDFTNIIPHANANDIIYCDPPYIDRNSTFTQKWDRSNEIVLHKLLSETPAKFILSSWKESPTRKNEVFYELWNKNYFNIIEIPNKYNIRDAKNPACITEVLITNF